MSWQFCAVELNDLEHPELSRMLEEIDICTWTTYWCWLRDVLGSIFLSQAVADSPPLALVYAAETLQTTSVYLSAIGAGHADMGFVLVSMPCCPLGQKACCCSYYWYSTQTLPSPEQFKRDTSSSSIKSCPCLFQSWYVSAVGSVLHVRTDASWS